jgi:hypothetical protein
MLGFLASYVRICLFWSWQLPVSIRLVYLSACSAHLLMPLRECCSLQHRPHHQSSIPIQLAPLVSLPRKAPANTPRARPLGSLPYTRNVGIHISSLSFALEDPAHSNDPPGVIPRSTTIPSSSSIPALLDPAPIEHRQDVDQVWRCPLKLGRMLEYGWLTCVALQSANPHRQGDRA